MAEHFYTQIIWKPVPKEIEKSKEKVFDSNSSQLKGIVSEPFGIHAHQGMEEVAKEIYKFEVRSDDVWIVSYPKCGTTLTQVIYLPGS